MARCQCKHDSSTPLIGVQIIGGVCYSRGVVVADVSNYQQLRVVMDSIDRQTRRFSVDGPQGQIGIAQGPTLEEARKRFFRAFPHIAESGGFLEFQELTDCRR